MQSSEDGQIDYFNCEDCRLSELGTNEAETHRHAAGHTVVPVYV